MEEQTTKSIDMHKAAAVGIRVIQAVCLSAFIFGLMWEGSIGLQLRMSQFLMLYGAVGALVSEAMVRVVMAKATRFQAPAKPKRSRPRKA